MKDFEAKPSTGLGKYIFLVLILFVAAVGFLGFKLLDGKDGDPSVVGTGGTGGSGGSSQGQCPRRSAAKSRRFAGRRNRADQHRLRHRERAVARPGRCEFAAAPEGRGVKINLMGMGSIEAPAPF